MASPQTHRSTPLGRIPCDFPECETTFTRQQDMNRHKQEKHADAKHCPWCDYEARRDQRLLAHIDLCHRPKKHRSSGDLNPSVQYEDLRAEDTAQPEVEVAEGESSVQAIGGGNDQVFGFGFSGERSLSQKNNHDHSPTLNQFVPSLSSSQSFTTGNQAILKQAYPAASSAGSGFPHLSKRRSREIAQRTSLPKGSRNLAAKADLTSRDDWQKANHTTANQMLTSVDRADDILNVTSFNQIQRYQGTPPYVQVLPKTLPATFFSCNRTPFDEHATAPYMPSQQSTAFLNPLQNHMQTQIIPPITCYGRTQMPVQPSYTSPSANAQRSQQPTMSFASSQSPFFYNTPDEPPSRN